MKANKYLNKTARVAGVLFILATASGVAAAAISLPMEEAPNVLAQFSTQNQLVKLSAFLQILMAFSCAGIGLALFPILKARAEKLALPAAGFRLLESGTQILIASSPILILALSQSPVLLSDPGSIEAFAHAIQTASGWLADGPMLLAWCTAALIYYSVFYRYQFIPRWLSGWGLVGITLTITFSLMRIFSFQTDNTWLPFAANLPIALQEMVFAIWLIVRGVDLEKQETHKALARNAA
jgi:hypothetical protein